jgi:hypothetical protein
VFRIYYSFNAVAIGDNYTLKRGTLKIAAAATAPGTVSTTTTIKQGGSCTKLGAKTTASKVKLTCKKVKTKLIWSK